ncbi:DUF58 domain-containing protein [Halobacteriales archaeon QS_8_69_26]|nr:MAG: DUF58 domain-containing protein [Halobacteriales archaeon QS_8_69_26]
MRRVDRYSGGLAGTALLAAAGLVAGSPTLLVAATVPMAFVAYGALTRVRVDPTDVRAERTVDRETPLPGERVRVRLSVENEGPTVTDLRVADGVPDELPVVEGSPREILALERGETATVEYAVETRRGHHEFGPMRMRVRDASGTNVGATDRRAGGADGLTCEPSLEAAPVRRQTGAFAGAVRTDAGGSGVEFHSTREYRRGDPVNRVDWRRLAKTGDLTTVDYREHRAATVLLLVDSRRPCHVAPTEGGPTAAATCAYGAQRLLDVLRSAGHDVGTAALGLVDPAGGPAVVEPGRGDEHRLRALELLETAAELPDEVFAGGTVPGDAPSPPGDPGAGTGGDRAGAGGRPTTASRGDRRSTGGRSSAAGRETPDGRVADGGHDASADRVRTLSGRLPSNTQVVLLSPVLDGYPETVTRVLGALGHRVTVVSPDATGGDEAGGRLLAVERDLHLEALLSTGAVVVDWDRERPLEVAMAGTLEGVGR